MNLRINVSMNIWYCTEAFWCIWFEYEHPEFLFASWETTQSQWRCVITDSQNFINYDTFPTSFDRKIFEPISGDAWSTAFQPQNAWRQNPLDPYSQRLSMPDHMEEWRGESRLHLWCPAGSYVYTRVIDKIETWRHIHAHGCRRMRRIRLLL